MSINYTSDGEPRPNYIPDQDIDASERAEQRVPVDDPLSDFEPEDVWAKRHHINRKTVARYRNLPDGLPFLVWGGRIFIPKKEGAEFIRSLLTQKNPTRKNSTTRKRGGVRRPQIEANP